MKRKLVLISVFVIIVIFSFIFSLYGGKKSAEEAKPNLIFWQIEKGVGIAGWFSDVIADINANEDFQVEMVENPIGKMQDLVTAAAVSQSGFDFLYEWAGPSNAIFRGKAGAYQPVNDLIPQSLLKPLKQSIVVSTTDSDGKLWGVPFQADSAYMCANIKHLERAGIDPKKITQTTYLSWEEFIAMCEKVKNAGIIPISFAIKEGYMAELWMLDLLHQYFDNERDILNYFATANFNEPKMRDAMGKFKYLYANEYFDRAGETIDYASHYFGSFSSGRTAFIWMINNKWLTVIKEGEVGEDNVIYFPFPIFGNGKLNKKLPGLGYVFCIAQWTKYPKECAKSIEYFVSEKWQTKLLTEYGAQPAYVNINVDPKSLTPNMQFLSKHELSIMGYEATVGLQFDGLVRNATPYLHGEITYEEFAKRLKESSTVE